MARESAAPHDDPSSLTFCGRMYGEAEALEAARAYQEATPWDERRPPAFVPGRSAKGRD